MADFFDDSDAADEESPLSQLRSKLKQCSTKSAFAKTPHEFVPKGCVDQIITRDKVLAALNITEPTTQEQALVQFVLKRAKRIFAVAVFAKIDVKVAIEWFKNKDVGDDHPEIPFQPKKKGRTAGWRGDFCDCQWRFFAPVFLTTEYSQDFKESEILPFLTMSRVSGEGAFGEVSRIEIHPNHTRPVSKIQIPWSGNRLTLPRSCANTTALPSKRSKRSKIRKKMLSIGNEKSKRFS
jgi:hypothetical protein